MPLNNRLICRSHTLYGHAIPQHALLGNIPLPTSLSDLGLLFQLYALTTPQLWCNLRETPLPTSRWVPPCLFVSSQPGPQGHVFNLRLLSWLHLPLSPGPKAHLLPPLGEGTESSYPGKSVPTTGPCSLDPLPFSDWSNFASDPLLGP